MSVYLEFIDFIVPIETIKENAMGFVNSLELLTNFDIEESKRMLFIFYKEIEVNK